MDSVFSSLGQSDLKSDQKVSLSIFTASFVFLFVALIGAGQKAPLVFFLLTFGVGAVSGCMFIWQTYGKALPGIKNDHIATMSHTAKGSVAWFLAVTMTLFYVCLYWFPQYLKNLISMMDPFSHLMRGKAADQWFLYGSFYTVFVLVFGFRAILKYKHSKYQIYRTLSVMFFQLIFAYIVPAMLIRLNQPEYYFTYFWPLSYNSLFPGNFETLRASGNLGMFVFFWGAIMTFIATPILTYFYGKRWYCSWVCGCGGLAETLGDPFRQNSDKSLKAWKIERVVINTVIILVTLTTILLWVDSINSGTMLGSISQGFKKWYGFFIGAAFSGVVGVGFYPLMGSRVWCRFGCPMAGLLGMLQKFYSRFRITTNGGQCISCGNCSKYCEMGIDVRWYAQRGQDIVRSSCVGCGVCSSVCPRGVLSLENGPKGSAVHEEKSLVDQLKAN